MLLLAILFAGFVLSLLQFETLVLHDWSVNIVKNALPEGHVVGAFA
jgi:hypothetical protein